MGKVPSFNLHFPAQNADMSALKLEAGEMIFVLGANGTGKSSLMLHFAQNNLQRIKKISAHRQTWMQTNTLEMTPASKLQTEQNIQNNDRQRKSRYRDDYAAQRASMTIYELIDAENVRAREITSFVDQGNINAAAEASKKEAPIAIINELLLQSNIPVTISIRENECVMARKDDGPEYSAAELSDGERNALLIAGNVLTAPDGALLIIDEPERHLHRSIISPLLKQLFERRPDCGFVVSTHDHDLPLQVPEARILLLRSCTFNGQVAGQWDADELSLEVPIDNFIKRDLLGARRRILFVEGAEHSLDKSLYSLIFPMVSIIPKGSCREVENAVGGAREAETYHWLRAFGIVDGDGYTQEQIEEKKEVGVYALPFYSVEAIYFHPKIVEWIAQLQANVTGKDADTLAKEALAAGINTIKDQTKRLSEKATKKSVRKMVIDQIPNDDELLMGRKLIIHNDANAIQATRKAELDEAVLAGDWESVLTKGPVRESGSLATIARTLGFQKRQDYECAVRHLLGTNDSALAFVKRLFGDLDAKLDN